MDSIYSLKDESEKKRRLESIYEPHIRALTNFVDKLVAEKGNQYHVPYFDPLDGGIDAEFLFLFEAPGPKAVITRFISRNNPDQTAKNMFEINNEIGLERKRTILWNIVPWYIGNGQKIRPANTKDIEEGIKYTLQLLDLLPRLKSIILVGQKAQKAEKILMEKVPDIKIFKCPHPSPLFINREKGNRDILKIEIRKILE